MHKTSYSHSAVRWLSCRKVLERFVDCFDAVKAFLAKKGQDFPELEDEKWVEKLVSPGHHGTSQRAKSPTARCRANCFGYVRNVDGFCWKAGRFFTGCGRFHFPPLQIL